MPVEETIRWHPETAADRDLVLEELNSILSSQHFRNSRRYPALLRYVVEKTLEGEACHLKERTLGIEVFDRPVDYDTSVDPVVRFSAAETRKRIALFYHENDRGARLQIHLPLGSYIPSFRIKSRLEGGAVDSIASGAIQAGLPPASETEQSGRFARLSQNRAFQLAASLLVVGLIAVGAMASMSASVPIERLWRPLLSTSSAVMVIIGEDARTPRDSSAPASADPTPEDGFTLCDGIALSRISEVLGKNAKAYKIKASTVARLQDLHDRSVVLIGAYDNPWTMLLTQHLRFHFEDAGGVVRIVDTNNPGSPGWSVDHYGAGGAVSDDYAIVARYADQTTGGTVLVIAGTGAYGTQAAGEFVAAPRQVGRLLSTLPNGWENKNIELIVKTSIIDGEPTPLKLVSAATW